MNCSVIPDLPVMVPGASDSPTLCIPHKSLQRSVYQDPNFEYWFPLSPHIHKNPIRTARSNLSALNTGIHIGPLWKSGRQSHNNKNTTNSGCIIASGNAFIYNGTISWPSLTSGMAFCHICMFMLWTCSGTLRPKTFRPLPFRIDVMTITDFRFQSLTPITRSISNSCKTIFWVRMSVLTPLFARFYPGLLTDTDGRNTLLQWQTNCCWQRFLP